jgi:hypothetical protein
MVLKVVTKRNAVLRALLGAGIGALFGFQGWRLAQEGYPVAMPWYGALWVFACHAVLGVAVAVTGRVSWWKRGAGLGVLFSLPSVLMLRTVDRAWAPLAIALCAGSIAAGMIIAFLTDTVCPLETKAKADRAPAVPTPEHHSEPASAGQRSASGVAGRRLKEGKRALDDLDRQRRLRHDESFGHEAEDRIVWRELIDLELQEIDSQLDRYRGDQNKSR